MRGLVDELRKIAIATAGQDGFGQTATRLDAALANLAETAEWLLLRQAEGALPVALSGATPFLRLFGLVLSGCYLAKGALVAAPGQARRIALCRFFAENLLSETAALKDRVVNGAESLALAASHLPEETP